MAEIYRARTRSAEDPTQARWVALKMMRPSIGHEALREQLFKREARICSAIHHPNIVPLYEFGREQDRYYISMEFIRGRDLSHLIKSAELNPDSGPESDSEPVSFGAGMYIAVQAAKGLGHAHRLVDDDGVGLQIVHRDVSPGNVMVGYDGSVKVLDFGVARINESQGLRTQTGTLRGKFAYMAPEQTLGLPVDARSDIFSFGILLYELLTGSNPFRARSPVETLERVQRVRPVPPSRANRQIPKAVDSILARCLAKDPRRRFADGAELHEALAEFLDKRNLDEHERLVRYMNQRFVWEKAEEAKELAAEEDEVTLIEVVDFEMKDDDDLDARFVVIPDEQEASQSDLVRAATGAQDGAAVFGDDDAEPTVALPTMLGESEDTVHSTGEGGRRMQAALDRMKDRAPLDDGLLDEDSNETVAQPASPALRAWMQQGGGSREVQASSLLAPIDPAARPSESTNADAEVIGRDQSPWRRLLMVVTLAAASAVAVAVVVVALLVPPKAAPTPVRAAAPTPTKIDPVTIQVAPPPPAAAPQSPADTPTPATVRRGAPTAPPPPAVSRRSAGSSKKRLRRRVRPKRVKRRPSKRTAKRSGRAADTSGYLNVGATPWAEISIDGKPWPYQTPQAGIELNPGKHIITLRNPKTGVTKSTSVVIKAGAYRTIKMDMSKP